jgi:hypothetical protein
LQEESAWASVVASAQESERGIKKKGGCGGRVSEGGVNHLKGGVPRGLATALLEGKNPIRVHAEEALLGGQVHRQLHL